MVSLFHRKTLQPAWRYATSDVIWKLVYAEIGLLLGEHRNMESKQASFFCLDARTGNVLWQQLMLEEPWWIGMEAVEHDLVFFHRYAHPELPEHKSIEARNCRTGELLWTNSDLIFWFALDDKVYANKNFFEKRVTYCLNAATGEVLGECADVAKEYAEAYKKKQETIVQYPVPMDSGDESESVYRRIKKEWKDRLLLNSLETIHAGDYDIAGFYTDERANNDAPDYSAHLEIFRSNGLHAAYSVKLSEHLPIATPDLFFVAKNIVYCIDHQKTLLALSL
ncbi:MAG TPA: DUF4905 domain-containing protein [Bacteroidota bacterium]|nr:DUF4905 domain-containing protein [Bacteroidota bacterium]